MYDRGLDAVSESEPMVDTPRVTSPIEPDPTDAISPLEALLELPRSAGEDTLEDFLVTVRRIIINAGAGFLVPLTGDIIRMPGLPAEPAAKRLDVDENGNIVGLE